MMANESNQSQHAELMAIVIRHGIYLSRYASHELEAINSILTQEVMPAYVEALMRAIMRGSGQGWTAARLMEVSQILYAVIESGLFKAENHLLGNLAQFAKYEAAWQEASISRALPVSTRFREPNEAMLKALASERPFEGATMHEWWQRVASHTQAKITKQLQIGIAMGESPAQLQRRIFGAEVGSPVFGQGGEALAMRRQIDALVRTAIPMVSSEARAEFVKLNSDIIVAEQIVATLDGSTSSGCRARDGKLIPPGGGPRPPYHWRCRTTLAPVLKTPEELGLKFKRTIGTRASMNGPVPETMTYQSWLRTQSDEFQDDVLGPVRGRLFRDGTLTLDRFVDEAGRRLSLREIAQREGLAFSWLR